MSRADTVTAIVAPSAHAQEGAHRLPVVASLDALDVPRAITLFRDERDNHGRLINTTYRTWIASLRKATPGTNAFSPAAFTRCPPNVVCVCPRCRRQGKEASCEHGCHGSNPPQRHRTKGTAFDVWALVLDYDGGPKGAHPTSIEDARALWPFAGLIYTTRNHMKAKDGAPAVPRFRVVLPLSRPVTADEHAAIMRRAFEQAEAAGHELDGQCKDPSRLWFLPPSSAEILELNGPVLDADRMIAEAPPLAVAETPPRPPASGDREATRERRVDAPGRPDAVTRALAFVRSPGVKPSIQGQNGSGALTWVAHRLVTSFSLSLGEALSVLREYNQTKATPPWSEKELGHAIDRASKEPSRTCSPGELLHADRPLPDRPSRRAEQHQGENMQPANDIDATQGEPREATSAEIIAAVLKVPRQQRTAVALRPEYLRAAAQLDPRGAEWHSLETKLRDARVSLREWRRAVESLRPARSTAPADTAEGDPRPVIDWDPSHEYRAVEEAITVLAREDEKLYRRDDGEPALIEVLAASRADVERHPFLSEGAPVLRNLPSPILRVRLSRYVRFERDRRVIGPPGEVVSAVMAAGQWPGVRPLAGVAETPMLRPDGSVLDAPGYDAATGYLYDPPRGTELVRVPENPTHEQATTALATLLDVFVDFPFDEDADRSVAVAAVLSMLARPALIQVPVFAFDASIQGTGKSLAAEAAHAIATGRNMPVTEFPEDAQNGNEEVTKRLTSMLLQGCSFVCWDNVDRVRFGGATIASLLTSGAFRGRVLGRSDGGATPLLKWRGVMFVTGNNLQVTRDMKRRVLRARQVSRFARPQDRPASDFQHPERRGVLIKWITEHRSELVAAGLTVLRAFVLAGRPRKVKPIDSFERWCDLIASAIVWAGGADPTRCLWNQDEEETDDEDAAYSVILRDWNGLAGEQGDTIAAVLTRLYPRERVDASKRGEPMAPDEHDALREALEALAPPKIQGTGPDKIALGHKFRALKNRPGACVVERPGAAAERMTRVLAGQTAGAGRVRWRVTSPKARRSMPAEGAPLTAGSGG